MFIYRNENIKFKTSIPVNPLQLSANVDGYGLINKRYPHPSNDFCKAEKQRWIKSIQFRGKRVIKLASLLLRSYIFMKLPHFANLLCSLPIFHLLHLPMCWNFKGHLAASCNFSSIRIWHTRHVHTETKEVVLPNPSKNFRRCLKASKCVKMLKKMVFKIYETEIGSDRGQTLRTNSYET